jgi:predicted helicase
MGKGLVAILGNPPYAVFSARRYPALDDRIRKTYAAASGAKNKCALYDSYIRAIRLATDMVGGEGLVAFVANSGFLDGLAMDGVRKHLGNDFDSIHILDLKGNHRTMGEECRRQGGNVFGLGSRTGIAIFFLIKKGTRQSGQAEIFLMRVPDYLTREQKLGILAGLKDIH